MATNRNDNTPPQNQARRWVTPLIVGAGVVAAAGVLWAHFIGFGNSSEIPQTNGNITANTLLNSIAQTEACKGIEISFDPCPARETGMAFEEWKQQVLEMLGNKIQECTDYAVEPFLRIIRNGRGSSDYALTGLESVVEALRTYWNNCPEE